MGFEIKDLYTKSGEEITNMLFSMEGLRENAVIFCEYVNKVGVPEALNSNLGSAIAEMSLNQYTSLYLNVVNYTLEFMEEVRKKEKEEVEAPLVPAMWSVLQAGRKLSNFDSMHVTIPTLANALEDRLSSVDLFFEYAYATHVSFCTRTLGFESMITDAYVDYLVGKYHFSQKEKEEALQEYSVKHLESIVNNSDMPEGQKKELIQDAKEKLNNGRSIGPLFTRLHRLKMKDLQKSEIGRIFTEALQSRDGALDSFFEEEEKKESKESSGEVIPKDDKGNTLQ